MTIVITGASSGLGYELSRRYIFQGHKLYCLTRNIEKLSDLVYLAEQNGTVCFVYKVDVTDFASLQVLCQQICITESQIDLVIANAGISAGHSSGVQDFASFKQIIDTNFTSVHALFEPFIHKMIEQKSGKLAIISSLASFVAMPTTLAYSASKRALNSYADSLRLSLLPHGVSVVNIQPGFIKTPMTDKNRFSMPFLMELDGGVDEIQKAIEKGRANHAFPFVFASFVRFLSILPSSVRDFLILKMSKNVYR